MKTILSFLRIREDWSIATSRCEKTTVVFNLFLQPGWLDYNHLYVFGMSLHQQEYKVLRKGLEVGLSKQQISNVFNSQEALGDIPPRNASEIFRGARSISIGPYTKEFVSVGRLLPR